MFISENLIEFFIPLKSRPTQKKKMNSLPEELHLMIFKLLPVQDTIRLRLVCKKWYRLLNFLRHEYLIIVAAQDCENYLFKPRKTVHTVECVDDVFLTTPIPLLLRSVKRLTAYLYSEKIINITPFLNQFTELEELTCYKSSYNIDLIILNLQHLNKLTIESDYCLFDLRTPRLTHLEILNFKDCDLYYPDRLQRLETDSYRKENFDFCLLKNLEILRTSQYNWSDITSNFLNKLRSLKELHFEAETFLSRDILNSHFTYRRDGLKLYLCGFDIHQNVEEDINFPHGDENSVSKFIVRNYEKTAEEVLHCVDLRVDYNELIKAGLKKDFFVKFPRLGRVMLTDKVADEEALLEFLTKTQPSTFSMKNFLLNQKIFSQIASCCGIRELELINLDLDAVCLEFDFIYEMKNFETITLHQPISIDFLLKAYQVCKEMVEVNFEFKRDSAFFGRRQVSLSSFVAFDDINQNNENLWVELYFDSDQAFLHFLGALRKEPQLGRSSNYLRELIFLINDLKYNEMLVGREVRRIVKNELFIVHIQPF